MSSQQELINLKNKFLALQQQLIKLKQFNLYINEIEYICNIIENIDKLTILQIEEIEKQIKLNQLKIFNDLSISVQFKRSFLQIFKILQNAIVNLSVIKIYNQL